MVSTFRHGGLHSKWIGVWSAVSTVGTVATPLLLHRPVLLVLVAPRTVAVALAAPHMSLVEFIVVGTIRLSVTDPSYFVLGRRFAAIPRGPRAALGPARRLVVWLFDLIGRSSLLAEVVLFVRPSGRYLAVAGAQGVPAWLAAVAAVAGTIAYLAAIHLGVDQLF